MLGLFDVSYVFQDCIWVIYSVWYIFALILSQILSWNMFEMSNKLNKIWLKGQNPSISKNERVNISPKFQNGLIPKLTES